VWEKDSHVFELSDIKATSVKDSSLTSLLVQASTACTSKLVKGESKTMEPEMIGDSDRLGVRVRSPGWPIVYQYWGRVLSCTGLFRLSLCFR
jgi:hypothetical protein